MQLAVERVWSTFGRANEKYFPQTEAA